MINRSLESGWRGSPDIWLDAAKQVLLDSGVDAVRILPLARKLGLSRTSFYWFFSDREAILDALLETWREKDTGNLEMQTRATSSTIAEALMNVMDCWLDASLFDSRFEFAIRSWALQSDAIMNDIQQADERRLSALTTMFMRYDFDPIEADVKSRTFYLTQIGYITMQARETLAVRMARIPAYVRTFTGTAPTEAELSAFHARHGFDPGSPQVD